MKLLTSKQLTRRAKEQYQDGYDTGFEEFAYEIEELKEKIELKNRKIKKLERDWENSIEDMNEMRERLQVEIDFLRKERTDALVVMKQATENDRTIALIDVAEKSLAKREKRLFDTEEGKYKEGYSDGVADGVRKINEITAVDRENMAKVAMVSAASHTSPEVMREINSSVDSITETESNAQAKKSQR